MVFHMVAYAQRTKNELVKPVSRDSARIFPWVCIVEIWHGSMFGNRLKRLNSLLVVKSAIHQTAYNHQTSRYVKMQIAIECTTSPRTKDLRFSGFWANNVKRIY